MKTVFCVVLLILVVVALLYYGYRRFWDPIEKFYWMADEFITMYETILPKIKGKDIDPEADSFSFEGEIFNETFERGDIEGFYDRMKQCAELTIKAYGNILEESLDTVDEEMYENLTKMYQKIIKINHEIRLADWKN